MYYINVLYIRVHFIVIYEYIYSLPPSQLILNSELLKRMHFLSYE